jgi:alkylation response protein AidB-like acyl-CoA dehydrogenase
VDFGLSDEQKLLEATLRRWLGEHAPPARVREWVAAGTARAPELWSGLAELGVTGILVPQRLGGSELTMLDAALAAQSLGWAATPAPFLSGAVIAPVAFGVAGTREQQERWLPPIAAGRLRFGAALTELYSVREGAGVEQRGERLYGKALFALDAAEADAFLVAAGRDALLVVERGAAGLSIEPLSTFDRTRSVAELRFDGVVPADALGGEWGAGTALGRMLEAGRIAVAADTLGACERALERAVAYAKERKQFGRAIGSFQAVKHLCAEMLARIEPARSLVWWAAWTFDAAPEQSHAASLLVKSHLAEVGTFVARTATEVHGGVGFTEEGELHLWFKRAALDRQLLGGPEQLRALVDPSVLGGRSEPAHTRL